MTIETFIATYGVNRKQTDSLKWDALAERYDDADLLPLWVADMEFKTPHSVRKALQERVAHGVFGYSNVPTDYFAAYAGWQARHEQTPFQSEWLFFSTGVVQSLYDLIACFTEVGDAVLIQPPVYYPFFNAIVAQERKLVTSNLVRHGATYQMDLTDFEQKIEQEHVKAFILCSPHNPVGRVWQPAELMAVLEICQRQQVLVIADEIHSDLVFQPFTSTVSLASATGLENLIVVNAPSKTFNLASLLHSHIWIPGAKRRGTYKEWAARHRQTENSSLGQLAAKVAYETGDQWLENLLQVIQQNYEYVKKRLHIAVPEIKMGPLEGTYLLWLDLTDLVPANEVKTYVQDQAKLAVDFGEWFSPETKNFIRLNLATTPDIIQEACDRLIAEKGGHR